VLNSVLQPSVCFVNDLVKKIALELRDRNASGPIALWRYVLPNSCTALSLAVTKARTERAISFSVVAHEQMLIRMTAFPSQSE
jgi:hypothetical protein